jgi:hypothetical protein
MKYLTFGIAGLMAIGLVACGSSSVGASATTSPTGTSPSDAAVEHDFLKDYFVRFGGNASTSVRCAHEYANDYVCVVGSDPRGGVRVTDDGHAFVITPSAAVASGGG